MGIVCVLRCTVCCDCSKQWSILSHYPTAYVWFIYIHGYPDNEAFNPGDPAVRTMNPITSCRLWDGMADSETDGCTRPAIQSHWSRLLPVSPVHTLRSNLSTGRGQRTWDWYIAHSLFANTHKLTCAQTNSWKSTQAPAVFLLFCSPLLLIHNSPPSHRKCIPVILWACPLHLLEEEEVTNRFCWWGIAASVSIFL